MTIQYKRNNRGRNAFTMVWWRSTGHEKFDTRRLNKIIIFYSDRFSKWFFLRSLLTKTWSHHVYWLCSKTTDRASFFFFFFSSFLYIIIRWRRPAAPAGVRTRYIILYATTITATERQRTNPSMSCPGQVRVYIIL